MPWMPRDWLERFNAASCARDRSTLRALRRDVYASTVEATDARLYHFEGRAVPLDGAGEVARTLNDAAFHGDGTAQVVPSARHGRYDSRVTVHNADFLEVGRAIAAPGEVPAVLNMANPYHPGGGVEQGAGAQEENLFRRSNLLYSLYQFSNEQAAKYGVPPNPDGFRYPIPEPVGGIFSPGVQVFRSTEATGYAFLPRPYLVNVITVAALPNPHLEERDGRLWLSQEAEKVTALKIRAILRIAAHHGQTALVLSAFGCGAFRNPPHHVAELFRDALEDPDFEGVFRHVAFAILDDHNAFRPDSPEGNYLPFERAFAGFGA